MVFSSVVNDFSTNISRKTIKSSFVKIRFQEKKCKVREYFESDKVRKKAEKSCKLIMEGNIENNNAKYCIMLNYLI